MKKILFVFICGFFLAGASEAQQIINSTTLAAAVTQNQTTITLTSVTVNIQNGGAAFTPAIAIGQEVVVAGAGGFEAMIIASITGTTLGVQRGVGGTSQKDHASGSFVFVGPTNRFYQGPPGSTSGTDAGAACTRAQIQFLPWIDLTNGLIWSCGSQGAPNTASTWVAVNPMPITFGSTGWLR